MLTSILIIK